MQESVCEVRLNDKWGHVVHTATSMKDALNWCDEHNYRTTRYGDGYVIAVKRSEKKGGDA